MHEPKKPPLTVVAIVTAFTLAGLGLLYFAERPATGTEAVEKSRQLRTAASRVNDTSRTMPAQTALPKGADESSAPGSAAAGLSISGSVLNLKGQRLADVEIVATARRSGSSDAPADEQKTRSDPSGRYRLDSLEGGDYRIRNIETSTYPSTRINVRGGTEGADLVLAARQELWVFGTVRDGDAPLPGVQVNSESEPSDATYSNVDGSFGLFLALQNGNEQQALEFSMEGYSDARLALRSVDPFATELPLNDVRLTPIEGQASVRGNVVSGDQPVAGARLLLHASDSNENYRTQSDASGNFSFDDVVVGSYLLTVIPKANYQDYTDPAVQVGLSGVDLRLSLAPLHRSHLRGQMVDADGNAIPGFSLWLSNMDARGFGSQSVVGDAQGRFEVGDVPAGRLALTTHSEPRIRISGISVNKNDADAHQLVLDLGNHVLEGRVTDAFSNALPGAQILMVWSHENDGITSYSTRKGVSDTSGYFRFSQLGPGVHIVNVTAAGFERARVEREVTISGELQIRLHSLQTGGK